MVRAAHFGILLFAVACGVGLSHLGSRFLLRKSFESTRWFIPGPLGLEPSVALHTNGRAADSAVGEAAELREPGTGRAPAMPASPRGFLTRAISGLRTAEAVDWGRRNGLGERLPFSHNLAQVFPPELAKTRPEFFPLETGRRLEPPPGSWFWNPDIARPDAAVFAAEAARRHFEVHPDAVSFALGVNDALIWGESPELVALTTPLRWFRERPDYSNLVFTFMNRAAEELSRTHPDKYLGALAYYWCEAAPDFPLHPRVIPFLTADRSQGYDAGFWQEERELQKAWGRLRAEVRGQKTEGVGRTSEDGGQRSQGGGRTSDGNEAAFGTPVPNFDPGPRRLGMYDYLYGVGFLIPRIHTRLLAENLRHARRVGFTDYYAEIAPNWGLDPITPWLTAQLLDDPEQPLADLLDEFYRRYFREAAGPMRRFFERCEDLWMQQPGPPYWLKHFRNESQAVLFPSAVTRELRGILTEAERAARSGRVRERIRMVSESFGVTERFVGFKESRDALIRASLAGAGSGSGGIEAMLGAYLEARGEFTNYTKTLMLAEPLALAPFGWDDYLRNDPVPLALAAIRARLRQTVSGLNAAGNGDLAGAAEAAGVEWPGFFMQDPDVAPLWEVFVRNPWAAGNETVNHGTAVELLRNPRMEGALPPPRTIAGLTYSVSLPTEWASRAEPAEHHEAALIDSAQGRILRVRGSKDAMLFQWAPIVSNVDRSAGAAEAVPQFARVAVRGRISPGTAVSLLIAWLDDQHRHVGVRTVRLPDGDWPDFVTLRQAGMPPSGAAWVGLGLRIQNQVAGDWIEAGEFSLSGPAGNH